jgi:hypothetical protein
VLEQQRLYLTPQAQYDFVRQLTQPPEDWVRRATTLHEPEVLTLIRKQVDSATFLRISDRSTVLDQRRRHADITVSAPTFVRDTTAIACKGRSLFRTLGLTHDNVNLRDDIALPATLPAGFDGDGPIPVERNQAESELLRQLEIDFGRYGNPVYAYEAFAIALRSGMDMPDWVQRHMLQVAECILGIRDAIAGGRPSKREAERVGKVLGFGKDGPGQGGWFKQAAMLQRDRTIFVEVEKRLEAGMKLDFAYDEVAKMLGVSRSTIVRSYQRIAKMVRE